MILIIMELNLVRENDFSKIETKNNICINVLCYENKLTFPIYVSDQKFKNSMDLLHIIQCRIQSYFEAGIPVWDPKLKPPNSQKC